MKALARYFFAGFLATFSLGLLAPPSLYALNPKKTLSQYTRTVWTQQQGLPQDTIRAITQTADGYLWLGTDEGLARFDGYEFAVFSKDHGELPSNSITTLAAGSDGSLWIGTANGLTRYQDHQFHTYTKSDGLPDNGITDVLEDHSGALWIVAGIYLSRYESGKFTTLEPGKDLPVTAVRTICEDRSHTLWIAGYGGVARLSGRKFVQAISSAALEEDVILGLWKDRHANLWMAGTKGLFVLSPEGKLRKYTARDGLPDPFVRSLWEDRDGNLWAGTNGGLARLEQGRFLAPTREGSRDLDWVRCIYEDREGDLWVGMNSGLNRFRDDVFTIYAKSEGLPSDEPTAVYQDRRGRIWIGFHDSGLVLFGDGGPRTYTTADGMPSNEVFSIREDQRGDLLVSTRDGFSRMHDGHFTNYVPRDSLARRLVFDALEDRAGRLWIATPGGLNELRSGRLQNAIPGGPLLNSSVVVLCPGKDDILWAGTYGQGLWRWQHGQAKLFTTADGLSNDQIRSLRQDPDGTLWIGTFGGGLNRLRDGRFVHYTSKLGLLSDNIAHIEDDGHGSLWLSTTRGICRIAKSQLEALTLGRIRTLTPINYGIEDGLRSAQCAPGYPVGGVGSRTTDGRLWFPTSRGLAVLDPNARKPSALPPLIHMVEMTVDGRPVDIGHNGVLEPGNGRLQIRYTGIHLSAPERVRYSYKLEGLDADWVQAGSRRTINYNSLKHGRYRFIVRAELPDGQSSENRYAFELLPHSYETIWFRCLLALLLMAAAWVAYQWRLRQIRGRFALVLNERARLAREIHDTLSQGFVGISSQLDAVAMCMPPDAGPARQHLDLARKMARHSITEARRSVMDLRASALEGQDLAAALQSGTRMWTAGSGVDVELDVSGEQTALPQELEQHLLRIAQEAVTNVLKHAGASKIWVRLHTEARRLYLRVIDNGRGFEEPDAFSALGGHFGLIGMRERAERLGGELHLASQPGKGTQVEVKVPLP